MDTNNRRPTAAQSVVPSDWRTQLPALREIVIYLIRSLYRLFPFSGQEGLEELKKIAVQYEEKIRNAAMSWSDYAEKIMLMMIILDSMTKNTFPNSLPTNPFGNNNRPPDSRERYRTRRQMPGTQQVVLQQLKQQAQNFLQHLYQQLSDQKFVRQQLQQVASIRIQKALMMQQLMAQQPNATNMQQNQLSGQQNNVGEMQQEHQRSEGQKNNLVQQHRDQQNLIAQNNMANMRHIYLFSFSGFSTSQQNMLNLLKPASSHQHLKQQREQHQMQQQLMKEQMLQKQQFNQQAKQQLPAQMQAHQMPQVHQRDDVDEPKIRPGMEVKPDVFQQYISRGQHPLYTHQQMKSEASISSSQLLQSASPLLSQHSSPEVDPKNLQSSLIKAETPLQSGKSSVTVKPVERLIRAVKSMSFEALTSSVSDISSVLSMIDRIAGSAPGHGSRAAVSEDLVAITNCRLQARNFITQNGMTGTRKMKRSTSAMSLESRATSSVKRPRIEVNHALLEEIREINLRLIDTAVEVSEEDVGPTAAEEEDNGIIVKGSFIAVALSPDLKSQNASAQMSPIQPFRLLVPTNYPSCSPVLLDKLTVETSKECEDLAVKAKSRFDRSLRNLSEPMSLEEIARTWDVCARAVISELAQQSGGGSFSSKYGTWENCLTST
ncbi:mediator of RNA polymerase II transcription subunit 15a-like isoform X2 [Euphorbia lathyris]